MLALALIGQLAAGQVQPSWNFQQESHDKHFAVAMLASAGIYLLASHVFKFDFASSTALSLLPVGAAAFAWEYSPNRKIVGDSWPDLGYTTFGMGTGWAFAAMVDSVLPGGALKQKGWVSIGDADPVKVEPGTCKVVAGAVVCMEEDPEAGKEEAP